MLVFACETSCDETSICILDNNKIVEHIVFSQEIHDKFGGVVPELASRSHLEILQKITKKIFGKRNIFPEKIDVFCATCGPGLIGSLLVGATFTKSLAISLNKPFVPINHLEGHILSTSFNNKITYPHLVLLLTGGHTQFYLMTNNKEIILLGGSLDDAIGEAFDKIAKMLGLGYPGGKEIERMAKNGDENFIKLPKPLINDGSFNFSFSGIKTHLNLIIKKNELNKKFIEDVSASFQKTISEIIIQKISSGIDILSKRNIFIKSISVVGGVANNKYILKNLETLFVQSEIKLCYPIEEMKSDNAAMIAWACFVNYNKAKDNIFFKPQPRLKINERL
tara:strand:- start:1286 stop:2296 length:1011 start_codon:yes stop_codon:yes gene_type:complete